MNAHVRTAVPETHSDEEGCERKIAPTWPEFVSTLDASWADFSTKRHLGDDDEALGRKPTPSELAIYNDAIDACAKAEDGVLDYRPISTEELGHKVVLLATHPAFEGVVYHDALLARDVASASAPPLPGETVHSGMLLKGAAHIHGSADQIKGRNSSSVVSDALKVLNDVWAAWKGVNASLDEVALGRDRLPDEDAEFEAAWSSVNEAESAFLHAPAQSMEDVALKAVTLLAHPCTAGITWDIGDVLTADLERASGSSVSRASRPTTQSFAAALAAYMAAENTPVEATDEAFEIAQDRVADFYDALMKTPSPDLHAWLKKYDLVVSMDVGDGKPDFLDRNPQLRYAEIRRDLEGLALGAPVSAPTSPTPLAVALTDFIASQAESNRLDRELMAVIEARDAACGEAPEEAWCYLKGERYRVYDLADVMPGGISWDKVKDFPLVRITAIQEAVRDFRERRAEASAKLNLSALYEIGSKADDAESAAFNRVLAVSPQTAFEFVVKYRFDMHYSYGFDFEDEDSVQEMLGNNAGEDRVHVYRDAMHLAGLVSATRDVKKFDPEAFVEEFERMPGHVISRFGASYVNSLAWGGPADEEFLVKDAEAIRAYDHHVETEIFAGRPGFKPHDGGPMMLAQVEAIDWAFPHNEAERLRYHDLWEQRRVAMMGPALGASIWNALPVWKRKEVLDWAKGAGR